jgi:hypothetical protein
MYTKYFCLSVHQIIISNVKMISAKLSLHQSHLKCTNFYRTMHQLQHVQNSLCPADLGLFNILI